MKKPFKNLVDYYKKLDDPRWKKRRSEILYRDSDRCQKCFGADDLQVHHKYYLFGKEPWEYPDKALITVCEDCHEEETAKRSYAEKRIIRALKAAVPFHDDLDKIGEALKKFPSGDLKNTYVDTLCFFLKEEVFQECVECAQMELLKKELERSNKIENKDV